MTLGLSEREENKLKPWPHQQVQLSLWSFSFFSFFSGFFCLYLGRKGHWKEQEGGLTSWGVWPALQAWAFRWILLILLQFIISCLLSNIICFISLQLCECLLYGLSFGGKGDFILKGLVDFLFVNLVFLMILGKFDARQTSLAVNECSNGALIWSTLWKKHKKPEK